MDTVIVYYTFGGSTKTEAEKRGAELNAPVYRVKEKHNRSLVGSFIPGGFQARKRKVVKIQPVEADLSAFDRIMIGCPVWAAYPAPAFNSIVELLPAGKEVEIFLCQGGADARASDEGTRKQIKKRGCTVMQIRTVTTGKAPSKMKE